jgi:hypothetical protein
MTRVPDETPSFQSDPDGDGVMADLRRQLEAAKARLAEHRAQAAAVGLARPAEDDEGREAS